MSANIQ